LYFFEISQNRNGLQYDPQSQSGLSDLVAYDDDETSSVVLEPGFVGLVDVETGPDGFLYILTPEGGTGEGNLDRLSSAA
jgi:aldose sugar dehydrogenase